MRPYRFVVSGALAGVVSTLIFTEIHELLISPIWFALPAMLVAGVVCGTCLAWSYVLVVPSPTRWRWVGYNGIYLLMFVALGVASLIAFEPVTTIAELLQTQEPPRELIRRALPLTAVFILVTAVALGAIYRPGWRGAAGILVTTAALVILLGLNISTLGLVEISSDATGVLVETFLLLVAIIGVYAAVVLGLNLRTGPP